MSGREYGYQENPANGLGIVRARTQLGNLRSWDIPRTERALEKVTRELGGLPMPGLYMLFHEKKVYIGESMDIPVRVRNHMSMPDGKIRHWDRAILINDGRTDAQSDLNDENIRLALEHYLITLFKINSYKVVSQGRTPSLNPSQILLVDAYKDELNILLTRKSKISKMLHERGEDEVYSDEVCKMLRYRGHNVDTWGKVEATVNGQLTFIRAGSPKRDRWQITFRGSKADSFKTRLKTGDGFLLVPRGPILLIPLAAIKELITDTGAFERDTIDVFVRFDEDKIVVSYKRQEVEVTEYSLSPWPT